MGIYHITADVKKNILFTTINGFCIINDFAGLPKVMEQETRKLHNPFVAITDLREFKPSPPEAQGIIAKAMNIAVKNGMCAAIRIVGQHVLAEMQFQRISQTQAGYKALVVNSMEEALEEAKKHRSES